MKRLLVAFVLLLASPAQAAPPELFVRQQRWDTHEETGPWLPLVSAPVFGYLGGYEVGYRLQASGFQRVALTVAGVPDGAPTQPGAATPTALAATAARATSSPRERSCSSRATGRTRSRCRSAAAWTA